MPGWSEGGGGGGRKLESTRKKFFYELGNNELTLGLIFLVISLK